MTDNETINPNQNWIKKKYVYEENEILTSGENNLDTTKGDLQELNLLKKSKRQYNGFILMGIGAFLGFISCLLTVLNPFPELYNIILYGLTTVAIIIIFWGLYFVIE